MSARRQRLADHVKAVDAARFTGRADVLAKADRLLDGDTSTRVLLVHGPGGIGKSALLREIGRRAVVRGRPVWAIDGRGLEPVPGELEKSLDGAADQQGAVVLIDAFERIPALDSLLRDRIVPYLAADSVVVVAGRHTPSRAWFRGGWEHVATEVALGPLPSGEAHELLAVVGVTDPGVAAAVVGWAGGSTLALNVAASAGVATDVSALASLDLNRMIVRRLAGDELNGIDGDVLEVAAVARAVDARLLAAVLPGRPIRAANEALRGCSVSELVGARVTLHDLVRGALRDDLRRRDRRRYGELRCRIADHLYVRAKEGEPRLLSDLIALIDDPGVRWGIGGDAHSHVRIDPWRADEVGSVVEAYVAHRGDPTWWRELAPLLAHAPETGLVARDVDGLPVGLCVAFPATRAPAAAAHDPVLAPVLADARSQGADQTMVFRESFGAPGSGGDAAVGALHLSAVLRSGLPNVDRSYILDAAPDADSAAFLQAVGGVHRPDLQAEVAGRRVAWWVIDHQPGGMLGQVRETVYAEAGVPAPGGSRRRDEDLHRAALDALRDVNRPGALATNPLAGCYADDTAGLQAAVRRAVQESFGPSPEDRLLQQVIKLGDLDPSVTHDQAMQRLSVSRATYFRHLRQAAIASPPPSPTRHAEADMPGSSPRALLPGSPGAGTDRRLTLVLGGVSTPVMKHVGDEAHAGKGVHTDSVSIACRRDGATGVVVLSGDLDLGGGDAVEATVAALLADGVKDVSVRADGLSFMDSSGLGGVLAARALVIEAGGEFRFGPTTDTVARVIDLAGVGDLLGPTTA